MKSLKRGACTVVLIMTMGAQLFAAMNTLKGTIVDQETKEPLIGATIQIVGTSTGTVTDFDGNYELNVADGIYDIEIKYLGYQTAVTRQVEVKNGKVMTLDLALTSDSQTLSEVQVVARASRESENVALMEQRRAVVATQSVGAKELSRKGVSDAQGAVAKVSGVSKQEGVKNVFVRGLGDRYNVTMLNGFPVPSEDPEYKNIALDLFGTDVIQSVGVNKVFNASGAGDVAGASIDILSKELVGESDLNVSASTGVNTQTVGTEFMTPTSSSYFGFASTAAPTSETSYSSSVSVDNFDFANKLNPNTSSFQMNHSYGLSGGKKFEVAGNPLTFYVVASHSTEYNAYDEDIRKTNADGGIDEEYLDSDNSTVSTNQLVLASLGYDVKGKSQFDYNFMMVHANTQSVTNSLGINNAIDASNSAFMRRQQTNDNLLLVNQFTYEQELSKSLNLEAGISYNNVTGSEPDRIINTLKRSDEKEGTTDYTVRTGDTGNSRYYSDLTENDLNVRAIFTYDLADNHDQISNVKVGYKGRFVDHRFEAYEYIMKSGYGTTTYFDVENPDFDSYYNAETLDANFKLNKQSDLYQAERTIHSPFVEATYQLASSFILNAGFAYDIVDMTIDNRYVRDATSKTLVEKDYNFWLPSLNMRYNLTEKQALRFGASKTYTMPQSKEFSEFKYVGSSFTSTGNSNLTPSDDYNVDLKWDFYPSPSELISVTAFGKMISNPIARVQTNTANGSLSYDNISDQAEVAGIEIELRKNIFSRPVGGEGMSKLTFGLNGSYIYTHTTVARQDNVLDPDICDTQLEGAAPWIANCDVSYTYAYGEKSFTNSLVLNYLGDRLYTIGRIGYEDITEQSTTTLDFVSSSKLNEHLAISFKATNLLNTCFQLTQDAENGTTGEVTHVVLNEYTKGINLSLGVSYNF